MPCHHITRSDEKTRHIGWGVTDNKGREIGVILYTRTEVVGSRWQEGDALGPGKTWNYRDSVSVAEGETLFYFYPRAARGGEEFGALTNAGGHFRTEAERNDAIEKYLEASRKRAHKTAGVEMLVI